MKLILSVILCFIISKTYSQQLTILPPNPTSGDTIYVISEFSYNGNCAFGMVHYSVYVTQDILILPTYCGYGDTSLCTSIDTFVVPPVPAGNYNIIVEYHQGSICPVSGFDATIGDTSATIVVTELTSLHEIGSTRSIDLFPNPSQGMVTITNHDFSGSFETVIRNITGQLIYRKHAFDKTLRVDTYHWSKGYYFVEIKDGLKHNQHFFVVN